MSKLNSYGVWTVMVSMMVLLSDCASSAWAQEITSFEQGMITFTNPDTSKYYRIEFKPWLTGPQSAEWLTALPVNIRSSAKTVTVPAGVFYRIAASDTPWLVVGGATGSATVDQVLADATFSNAEATDLTGSMPNRAGHVNAESCSVNDTTLRLRPQTGYYDGSSDNSVQIDDASFSDANIRAGVKIFGVEGKVVEATGSVADGSVLLGQTFSRAGAANRSGTMPNRGAPTWTPSTVPQSLSAGYYSGGTIQGSADLVAGNIKSGVEIFGVAGTMLNAAVPKTGQTTSYKAGDDGDLEKGVAWPNPRFTDHGDGSVTDNRTGLLWKKNANYYGANNWYNAIDYSSDFGIPDHFRLPTRFELESLLDLGRCNPALPSGHPFTNVGNNYWSSTTKTDETNRAWIVNMDDGSVFGGHKPIGLYLFWPVHDGR